MLYLMTNISTVKTLEKRITSVSDSKSKIYCKKCNVTETKLPM